MLDEDFKVSSNLAGTWQKPQRIVGLSHGIVWRSLWEKQALHLWRIRVVCQHKPRTGINE
jgi:hypothetical protein